MLTIKVEPAPGDSIQTTARDMVELANRLDVRLRAKFNDVELSAAPGGIAENIVKGWDISTRSGEKFKWASSHRLPKEK